MTNLTDFQRQLLTIIRDYPGINSTRLAEKLWPDSEAHDKPLKSGTSAVVKGRGISMSAGSHVAKLKKKGWVRDHLKQIRTRDRMGQEVVRYDQWGYELTEKGQEVLGTIEVYLTEDEKKVLKYILVELLDNYEEPAVNSIMKKLDL